MRKYSCSLLLFTIISFFTNAQGVYKEGIIVTKEGDSLKCYVKLEPVYETKVYYKSELMADEEYFFAVKKVRSIITKGKYLENIQLGKKDKLASLSVAGKDSLFYYLVTEEKFKQSIPGVNMTASSINAQYVLKKEGKCNEIERKNFKEQLLSLLNDCFVSTERLKQNNDNYDDIPNIIEEYNKCK